MAVLIWAATVLWIAALMVVATGGLVTDAAKSGRTTQVLDRVRPELRVAVRAGHLFHG